MAGSRGNNQLDNPAVEGFVVNSRDVTERVERERELQQSHELIRALSTTFPDYTFIHNDEGEYLDVITGWQGGPTLNTREELLGQTVGDILDAEVEERIQTAIDEALAEEALRTVEYPVETPVGDYWYEGTVSPLPDGYEGERAVVLAARDVTERRGRERDLERFQRIVSTMDDAVYALDPDGTGFGLAIVHEIASAHGWEIAFADAESGGARFEITGVEIVEVGTGFTGTE